MQQRRQIDRAAGEQRRLLAANVSGTVIGGNRIADGEARSGIGKQRIRQRNLAARQAGNPDRPAGRQEHVEIRQRQIGQIRRHAACQAGKLARRQNAARLRHIRRHAVQCGGKRHAIVAGSRVAGGLRREDRRRKIRLCRGNVGRR